MSAQMLSKFKYNHVVWFKYSFSSFGFDIYQAKFESSLPRRPIKIAFGKWFFDLRVFKWQLLINKMSEKQLKEALSKQQAKKAMQPVLNRSSLSV